MAKIYFRFFLEHEQDIGLTRLAMATKRSKASFVREGIEMVLRKHERKEKPPPTPPPSDGKRILP